MGTFTSCIISKCVDRCLAWCESVMVATHLQYTNTTPPNSTTFHDQITTEAQQIPSHNPIPANKLPKLLTSPTEIRNIIKTTPNNKVPGPDSIPNILLKNLPLKALTQLTYIINGVIKLQYFPKKWKVAIVIHILKPRKPPHDPNSYRPISLLNTIANITERVILRVLNKIVRKKALIPMQQFGFSEGYSTTLTLVRVIQDILKGYNRKQCTVVLLIDIEKVFATVWHNGLVYKLSHTTLHSITHQ